MIQEEGLSLIQKMAFVGFKAGDDFGRGCSIINTQSDRRSADQAVEEESIVTGYSCPFEVIGPQVNHGLDQSQRDEQGLEPVSVSHVDLNAETRFSLVLPESGLETGRPEPNAVQVFSIEIIRKPVPIDPGRPDQLEWSGGASSL